MVKDPLYNILYNLVIANYYIDEAVQIGNVKLPRMNMSKTELMRKEKSLCFPTKLSFILHNDKVYSITFAVTF